MPDCGFEIRLRVGYYDPSINNDDRRPPLMTTSQPPVPAPTPVPDPGASFFRAVDRVLYPLTIGATVVILGMQVYEFLQGGAYRPRYPYAAVYLPLLTAYSAQREGAKWKGEEWMAERLRRGELYVGSWVAAWLAITTISAGIRQSRPGRGQAATNRRDQAMRTITERGVPVTSDEVAQELKVSPVTAWRLLEDLVKEGRLLQDNVDGKRAAVTACHDLSSMKDSLWV